MENRNFELHLLKLPYQICIFTAFLAHLWPLWNTNTDELEDEKINHEEHLTLSHHKHLRMNQMFDMIWYPQALPVSTAFPYKRGTE